MGEAKRRGTTEQRARLASQRDTAQTEELQAVSDLIKKGIDFEASVLEQSEKIRDESKRNYLTEWLDSRLTLLAITRHLLDAKQLVPGHTSEEISHRLILLMVFFQGTYATETLISEGQYIKAAAVLKQDYEIIARISEVHAGTAKPGQTPQVRHLADEVKKYYGELNKVAHPSNQEALLALMGTLSSGERNAVSYLPSYHKESSQALYELHIWLILSAVQEYLRLFIEMYGTQEPAFADVMLPFITTVRMLEKAGFKFE